VNGSHTEAVEQQAYLTRHLLDHLHAPLTGTAFLRGVLPTTDAVRIVTGACDSFDAGELTAYEIPLSDDDDEPVTAPLVLGWTRALAGGGGAEPDASVMGISLIRVDTATLTPAESTAADRVLRVLRTLAWPYVETPPSPALCGFLRTGPDRLRLYVAVEEAGGLIAADVRLSGAVTALLAALPSLVREEERWVPDETDPHCVRVVDLTDW
jgi:hypothetical protein